MSKQNSCRLYLITPPAIDDMASFADALAGALDAGDVAAVQLRLKGCGDDAVRLAALTLRPIVQARGAAFLMNDRPDLAFDTGCDGVHVGQDDTPLAEARAILGKDATVGVTCHGSRHLALEAAEGGADYVAFGAFYETATKRPKFRAAPDVLEWWAPLMVVPCVAIGGITPENCAPLIAAGADFLAVSGAVWNHRQGPEAAVRAFNQALAAGKTQPL